LPKLSYIALAPGKTRTADGITRPFPRQALSVKYAPVKTENRSTIAITQVQSNNFGIPQFGKNQEYHLNRVAFRG